MHDFNMSKEILKNILGLSIKTMYTMICVLQFRLHLQQRIQLKAKMSGGGVRKLIKGRFKKKNNEIRQAIFLSPKKGKMIRCAQITL
jgi:hypothetical protein